MRFFERQEIKDALSYLRLIANRNDDAAFERVVNTPTRGIGDRTLDVVRQTSRDRQLTLWQASRELLKEKALAGRAASALQRFMELIDALAQETTDMPLHVQTDRVIKDSGLRAMYEQEKGEKGQTRIENLEELVTATRQFSYNEEDEDLMPLQAFLSHAALEAGEGQADTWQDAVQLMTLHSAKGLEFPQVFIVGVEEGMFPSQMALDEGGRLEEERRLAYVGVTRAMQKLTLTYAETPPSVRERGLSPPVALYRRAAAGVRRRSASASHGEPPGKPSATGRADCRERYRLQVRPARTASEVWRRHYCQPRRQRRAQPAAGGFSGPGNQMAGGGLRPAGGSVTLRKISLFCNILLPLYVKAP
ncbi:DNA-dependent helicase II [Klebsiella pneumoniae]|uniref:DNA 3'-5' helicase II n=1 Tax=Klebsiella pneumoniae TaxID=573 RepID=A0A377XJN9_KLEPN|nr:DNA-dependent helicase II [Klebsiella pneumoniae]